MTNFKHTEFTLTQLESKILFNDFIQRTYIVLQRLGKAFFTVLFFGHIVRYTVDAETHLCKKKERMQ